VGVKHDCNEEDYRDMLEDAFATFYETKHFRGVRDDERQRLREAFLSGVNWLNERDNYDPVELDDMLEQMLKK
jgi:hypothetical protein